MATINTTTPATPHPGAPGAPATQPAVQGHAVATQTPPVTQPHAPEIDALQQGETAGAGAAQRNAEPQPLAPGGVAQLPQGGPRRGGSRDFSVAEVFCAAVTQARDWERLRFNPMGKLDEYIYQPSRYQARQRDAGQHKRFKDVVSYEGIQLALNILAPGYYLSNMLFGNGREFDSLRSTTGGALAQSSVAAVLETATCAATDGVVPWLATLPTYMGAAVGIGLGQVGAVFGSDHTQTCATYGARAGACITCALTQLSIGFNAVVAKPWLAFQALTLVLPPTVFFLAVGWVVAQTEEAFVRAKVRPGAQNGDLTAHPLHDLGDDEDWASGVGSPRASQAGPDVPPNPPPALAGGAPG